MPGQPFKEADLETFFPGRLLLTRSDPEPPEWAEYLQALTSSDLEVGDRSSIGAILFIWPYKKRKAVYAATWGTGHHLLRTEALYRDLGLRAALNLMAADDEDWDPNRLRAVRTKRVGPMTLISQLQASHKSTVDAFPINREGDQLRQVTGAPLDPITWGASVTGGTSLHVRRPGKPMALVELCKRVETTYRSEEYKTRYGWIDNVKPVNDSALTTKVLDETLASLLEEDASAIISPPDLVTWEDFDHFEYHKGRLSKSVDEPSPESLREFLQEIRLSSEMEEPDGPLKSVKLSIVNSSGDRTSTWPLSRCISDEVVFDSKTYILDEGALFLVSKDYLGVVNGFVMSIKTSKVRFPKAVSGRREGPYNTALANSLPAALLLDTRTVIRESATAIEICDVALASKHLIHVKRGLSSSSLSHLFAQGVVSADLLHMDAAFRKAVKKKIRIAPKGSGTGAMEAFSWLFATPFPTSKCTISYAILTGTSKAHDASRLPFFSKVNLRQRCQDLERMGFSYTLDLIPNKT